MKDLSIFVVRNIVILPVTLSSFYAIYYPFMYIMISQPEGFLAFILTFVFPLLYIPIVLTLIYCNRFSKWLSCIEERVVMYMKRNM